MANLNMNFDIVGKISADHREGVKKVLEGLAGVNNVLVNSEGNKVNVGYTAGFVTVQEIKETIESQGLDVSDKAED